MLAARKNDGKFQLSYLLDFPLAIVEFAKVCMNGAKKYARDDWKKGRPFRDTIDSLLRHVTAFQNGEGYYEETLPNGEVVKMHHMANAAWNCFALLEYSLSGRDDLDDRYQAELVEEVKPYEFKVGDTVRIERPVFKCAGATWVPSMDYELGNIGDINCISEGGEFAAVTNSIFDYPLASLELVK